MLLFMCCSEKKNCCCWCCVHAWGYLVSKNGDITLHSEYTNIQRGRRWHNDHSVSQKKVDLIWAILQEEHTFAFLKPFFDFPQCSKRIFCIYGFGGGWKCSLGCVEGVFSWHILTILTKKFSRNLFWLRYGANTVVLNRQHYEYNTYDVLWSGDHKVWSMCWTSERRIQQRSGGGVVAQFFKRLLSDASASNWSCGGRNDVWNKLYQSCAPITAPQ